MTDDLVLPDHSPFPPLQLTFEEQQHCHDLSLQLLERTLHSYDERLAGITPRHHASLDSARWKLQKTQENASLYSERIRRVRTDLYLPEDKWEDPTVLMMVGTIQAPLDEVMLGMAIPTFEALKIRVATLGNQDISGAMLARLIGATDARPFQNLSILYMASRLPWLVSKVVKPRDFVLLSASGIITTADGERIGYDLLQPAPLPQCQPLPKPMIRGKYMIGCLYREQEDGHVDLYIQQYLEPLGKLFDSFVISGTWQALLGFLSSPMLAESKKLQWCMADRASVRRRGLETELLGHSVSCALCSTAFGRGTHSRSSDQQRCVLCLAPVCSNCREKRVYRVLKQQLKKKSTIEKRQVCICRPCLELVQRQKAADIARYSVMDSTTPASHSAGHDSDTGRRTWGLLDSDSVPTWSPSQSLSMSSESFESFSW
uniref:FYVE-type domain-containing protein n=1 Tax=Hyaloperonospora arabidopsidis (strain Emoy2) TaxID=559515 RepID=M4B995_HYAAE